MGKITMSDIANALGVSRVSVWKAFHEQPGISERLKEQIFKKAYELGYAKIPESIYESLALSESKKPETTVALIVSRPNSSHFWLDIIHEVAKELSKFNVNLMYIYIPSSSSEDYRLPSVLFSDQINGAIILNVYDDNLIRLIADLSLPKVFLDTIPKIYADTLNGDLLLIEGRHAMKQLTDAIIDKGRTRIGFIGDIEYAKTNHERYLGFCDAMTAHDLPVNSDFCCTGEISIYDYENTIYNYLDSQRPLPEAIVCVSDFVAHYVESYLNTHDYRIPEDVALTGFDGSKEYANISDILTTANVHTKAIGKKLARMVLFRMDYPDSPHTLAYTFSELIFKESTDF